MNGAKAIKVVIDTGVGAGTAAIVFAMPHLAVPAAAAGEALKGGLHGVVDAVARKQVRAAELVVDAALQEGQSVIDFLASVASNERRALAFADAYEAAWRTTIDAKVRALGRSVGNLARDEALIDSENVWLRIFAQVDRPELRVLLAVRDGNGEHPNKVDIAFLGHRSGLNGAVWPLVETLVSLGLLSEVAEGMLIGLRPRFSGRFHLGPTADEFFSRLGKFSEEELFV